MTVTVQPDLMQSLERQETSVLLVRSSDPPDRVKAALEAAIPQIELAGKSWVRGEIAVAGQVLGKDGTTRPVTDEELTNGDFEWPEVVLEHVPVPGGQLLMIDFEDTPPELCQEIPGILARHLEEAGIQEAEICLPPELSDQRVEFLGSLVLSARAWLCDPYPHVSLSGPHIAPRLIDVAITWLLDQHQPGMELFALVVSMAVPLTQDTIRSVIDNVLASNDSVNVISSDFKTSTTIAEFGGLGRHTGVSLCASGNDWTEEQVIAQMRSQRDTIQSVTAELDWAGVTFHQRNRNSSYSLDILYPESALQYITAEAARTGPSSGSIGLTIGEPGQWLPGGWRSIPASSSEEKAKAARAVPPPMWYQVLSQELVSRLIGPPPGSVDLGNGLIELTIGKPEQWVPGHPDHDAIRAQGQTLFLGRSQRTGERRGWLSRFFSRSRARG